ncbi:MAG: MBL fold metallo-hydrolase [Promethearchaeota archaeon]|nr:MAG: MBL fold metallo-hydrolase [Candidatus Lokiarchaeota archaeon]
MTIEEFKFLNKLILVEELDELKSSFKIKSYTQKLKLMESKKIPQKPIKEVIEHFFSNKNTIIPSKVKNSISKIFYSTPDRIIILLTKMGKDIIWNRDKLVRIYGWFFFVVESEDHFKVKRKGKEKKQKINKQNKEEKTVKSEEYNFNDEIIIIKEKINLRALYKTKEYFKYIKLIKSKKIPQKPIAEVLDDFFLNNEAIPLKEKNAINKIIYYSEERVIVIKSLIGDKMYENLDSLVEKYGWYFYITGVPVGNSDISIAIDNVEKRFNQTHFENFSLKDKIDSDDHIRVSLFPIALKPNHNSLILGLGNLNILLDCGITEDYLDYIKDYLNNFDQFIIDSKDTRKIITKFIEEKKTPEGEGIKEFEGSEEPELDVKENFSPEIDKTNQNMEFEQPKEQNHSKIEEKSFIPKIDAIFISHSHFDHISGLKEFIKLNPEIPILCSRITLDLYLLRDSDFLKQENYQEIEDQDYVNIIRNVIYVENGDKIEFKDKDCYLSFYHAGHMPGALMMLAKVKDFRFLFTGDYTYDDISPFAGTRRFLDQISRPIDFLLIDASSAKDDFGNISDQFHSLILFLEQKAEYGDNCLIGADPSSLAISFMLIFWRYFRKLQLRKGFKKRPNIYVDQMVRKNIQVINHRYEYIYGPISRLIRDKANPFNSIKFRWFDLDDLEFLRKRNNIIISHPPDLSYGIIRNIINVIGRSPHNLVFLSGAIHEEPAESLINPPESDTPSETREIVFSETWKMPFRALLINTFAPQIKIKLHGDRKQLNEMIKNLQPKEVCFFHQSPKALIDVAKEVELSFDFVQKVSVPHKRKLMILN